MLSGRIARLPACTIGRFTGIDDYTESLREFATAITLTQSACFVADLVRIDLMLTKMFDLHESAPRIASFAIPMGWCYALYATQQGPPQIWNGNSLRFGEVLLAKDAAALQQHTSGVVHFGAVGIRRDTLEMYADGLSDHGPAIPAGTIVVRMRRGAQQKLLQLHARIIRTSHSRPRTLCRQEVARSIDQELIEALVTAFLTGDVRSLAGPSRLN